MESSRVKIRLLLWTLWDKCAKMSLLFEKERLETGRMGMFKLKENTLGDCLMAGGIVAIGLAEACHLAAVLLGLSFSQCSLLLGVALGAWGVLGTALLAAGRRRIPARPGGKRPMDRPERILYGMFALMVISQLIFIGMGNAIYRKGDMMVETVGSFLAADGIYRVNPMTGTPYTEGMPLRLKILCLPTLYGSLCRWTGLAPVLMVQRIVPMAVLLGSYGAFSVLGRTLFPQEGRMRALFLLLAAALMWAGAYAYGMEGFGLLCSGWRGVSIRGGVLLPWTASLCLRRKWLGVGLCVLAEACMVWTFYGCGACLAMAVGLAAAGFLCRKLSGRAPGRRAAEERKGDGR